MKVTEPGHVYQLAFLDGAPSAHWGTVSDDTLTFVKRVGPRFPGNDQIGNGDAHPGTTMQEVLRALIDRVHYLDAQEPHPRNQDVIASLRRAIYDLELRAAQRHGRLSAFYQLVMAYGPEIEHMGTCPKCLHIGCEGGCHAN